MADAMLASDAERMDRHYRLQRHVYDLTRKHYLLGRKRLVRELSPPPGATVLEVGCGTAWNLAALAEEYPNARLMGIDVSAAMLETARASLERKGLAGRVTLRQGDATSFDAGALFGIAGFDRVVISYALSMIPCWREALDHAAGLVAPGGEMHITDFGQCAGLPRIVQRALFAFLERYSVTPRPDLEQRCHEAAAKYGLTVRFERMHRGYADYAVLSRPAAT